MRTLASVQRIASLTPIKGADAIECAQVLGWNVVVKKGEFQPGDRVVYVEIDSLLPERPEFEFLRKACFKPAILDRDGKELLRAGFRVRTVKLRGQVSQGICFPLSILPSPLYSGAEIALSDIPDGADVADPLGIVKWEMPEELGGHSLPGVQRSTFPNDIPKTDETRVQVLGGLVAACKGHRFGATEKLDGTSFTAFMRAGVFGVCSRNQTLDLADTTHLHVELANRLGLEARMLAMTATLGDFAIQGEMVGPRIQGNKYGLDERKLYVFDVYIFDAKDYLAPQHARDAVAEMGLASVPWLHEFDMDHKIADLVEMADGKSLLNSGVPREGIVVRPLTPMPELSKLNRVSFKAINPKFLLRYDALEDLAAGKPFEDVKRAFAAKMHPTKYQRPVAPPSAGNIAQAEKLFAQLRTAGSLNRRYAQLADVLPHALWKPAPPKTDLAAGAKQAAGVFGHLLPKRDRGPVDNLAPPQVMTWVKFRATVLPTAEAIEMFTPDFAAPYVSLVTALDPTSPPILQWDRAECRNPVSWYFHTAGSTAEDFGLRRREYVPVDAIALQPNQWNGEGFAHQGEGAHFILRGCYDTNPVSGGLFVECLKSEYHGVRSTLEAYLRTVPIAGAGPKTAAGLALQRSARGRDPYLLRVTAGGIRSTYKLDRWD